MIDELQIIALILEGESQKVDFKRQIDIQNPKAKGEFVKDIVSLANSSPNGGYILVGVDDDRSAKGFTGNFTEEQLQQIASSYINPPVNLSFQVVRIRFPHEVIVGVIEVKSPKRPHKVTRKIEHIDQNSVFVRHGSVVERASPEEIIILNEDKQVIPKMSLFSQPTYKNTFIFIVLLGLIIIGSFRLFNQGIQSQIGSTPTLTISNITHTETPPILSAATDISQVTPSPQLTASMTIESEGSTQNWDSLVQMGMDESERGEYTQALHPLSLGCRQGGTAQHGAVCRGHGTSGRANPASVILHT